jgi:hypothetical protein
MYMKKLILIALMVAGAIAADAQNDSRYERRSYENRDDDRGRDERRDYDKNKSDNRYESRGNENRENSRTYDRNWDNNRNDRRYEGYERWDRNGRYDHNRDRRFDNRRGYSQRYGNPIDDMQRDIRREIEWGARKGSLTYNEQRRLSRELDKIENREDRYFRDGYLSQWEFDDLARDLYQLDREVSRQRRDWDRRW